MKKPAKKTFKPFAKIRHTKVGSKLKADGGFTCLKNGAVRVVRKDQRGQLYIKCDEGQHMLSGQHKGDYLNGLYTVPK